MNNYFTGKTYFFKGRGFWKFNDLRMRVEHYEQKPSAPVWMGCKQDYEQNDLNQKLPYINYPVSATSASSATLATLIFSLLLSFYFRVV